MQSTSTRELQWAQSLLFTPKAADGRTVPDYLSPKPARSSSPGSFRHDRSLSPGSFNRRRSLTPGSSFRDTPPPPPPSETLLDSPLPGAAVAAGAGAFDTGITPTVDDVPAVGPSVRGSSAQQFVHVTAIQPDVDDGWVTVYGFQQQQLELVLQEFQKCGDIVQFGNFGQSSVSNWVHIQFQNKYAAQRAMQRSGLQLTPTLMIGVKPLDSEARKAVQRQAGRPMLAAAVQNKLVQVRPYSLDKQAVLVPHAASTWHKVSEFIFGL